MYKIMCLLAAVCALTAVPSVMQAASSATQTVTFQVNAINEISVSGNPANIVVNGATAGSEIPGYPELSTTYSVTCNDSATTKITGKIDTAMPSGVTLSATLGNGLGASAGSQFLSTTPITLVGSMTPGVTSGQSITYVLNATAAAGVISSTSRTVTLTLI